MPEASPDNLHHEDKQERGLEESGSSLRAGSSASEAAHSDTVHTDEEREAATSPQQLREAVFAKANPSSAETVGEPEPERVSLWQKIKHSALYGNKQKAAAALPSSDRSSR